MVCSPAADRLSSIQLSTELRTFLKERLSSADQIEIVLLLLHDPARSWTAPEVAQTLNVAPEATAMRLFLLASQGLIAFEADGVPRYRYAVADPNVNRLLHELGPVYEEDRTEVLRAMGLPAEADPVQTFADAFKLKK